VVSADLWITSCGVFEAEINGSVVGDHVLSPGLTSYRHRHRLIHHDVGSLPSEGESAIGITVAEGWYRGRIGFGGGVREIYGAEIGPIALLEITHPDGTVTRVVTDAGGSGGGTDRVRGSAHLRPVCDPGEMTSFNHYALGAVASFLHRRVAGLAPAAPGYSRLAIRPLPGGGLSFAEASRELPTGRARVRWDRVGEEFRLHLEIPDDVLAEVEMPDGSALEEVAAGVHDLACRFRASADDPPRPAPLFPPPE
jgi:hypothetical protein